MVRDEYERVYTIESAKPVLLRTTQSRTMHAARDLTAALMQLE